MSNMFMYVHNFYVVNVQLASAPYVHVHCTYVCKFTLSIFLIKHFIETIYLDVQYPKY